MRKRFGSRAWWYRTSCAASLATAGRSACSAGRTTKGKGAKGGERIRRGRGWHRRGGRGPHLDPRRTGRGRGHFPALRRKVTMEPMRRLSALALLPSSSPPARDRARPRPCPPPRRPRPRLSARLSAGPRRSQRQPPTWDARKQAAHALERLAHGPRPGEPNAIASRAAWKRGSAGSFTPATLADDVARRKLPRASDPHDDRRRAAHEKYPRPATSAPARRRGGEGRRSESEQSAARCLHRLPKPRPRTAPLPRTPRQVIGHRRIVGLDGARARRPRR